MNLAWKPEIFPELMELSPSDRKKVWAACVKQTFKNRKTWLAQILFFPIMGLLMAALFGLAILLDLQSGFPYFSVKTFFFYLVLTAASVCAGLFIRFLVIRAAKPVAQTYIEAYILENHLVKTPSPQRAPESLLWWKVSVAALAAVIWMGSAALGIICWNQSLDRMNWEIMTTALGSKAGALSADKDFHAGLKRVYEIDFIPLPRINIFVDPGPNKPEPKPRFTGRTEGGFQIWSYPLDEAYGAPGKTAINEYVNSYNGQMRALVPEKTTGHIPELL